MKKWYDSKHSTKTPVFKEGDEVLMKQKATCKTDPLFFPEVLKVQSRNGTRITVRHEDGRTTTRNSSFFKHVYK